MIPNLHDHRKLAKVIQISVIAMAGYGVISTLEAMLITVVWPEPRIAQWLNLVDIATASIMIAVLLVSMVWFAVGRGGLGERQEGIGNKSSWIWLRSVLFPKAILVSLNLMALGGLACVLNDPLLLDFVVNPIRLLLFLCPVVCAAFLFVYRSESGHPRIYSSLAAVCIMIALFTTVATVLG
ncbi:MAG: hypothetical protein ACRD22_04420 [Terriglobia bacterium]